MHTGARDKLINYFADGRSTRFARVVGMPNRCVQKPMGFYVFIAL